MRKTPGEIGKWRTTLRRSHPATRSTSTTRRSNKHSNRRVRASIVYLFRLIPLRTSAGPWEKDPHYFKDIQISALALLKMVMHARSGGSLEIMGLLLGKVVDNTMVSNRKKSVESNDFKNNPSSLQLVMDAFALPVEGTETRVNAQAQAYEYMTAYIESAKEVGKLSTKSSLRNST